MNQDLVKQLAEKAGFTIGRRYATPDYQTVEPELMSKFAELLVQACLDEIAVQAAGGSEMPDGSHNPEWDRALECVDAMIRWRFGLERPDSHVFYKRS